MLFIADYMQAHTIGPFFSQTQSSGLKCFEGLLMKLSRVFATTWSHHWRTDLDRVMHFVVGMLLVGFCYHINVVIILLLEMTMGSFRCLMLGTIDNRSTASPFLLAAKTIGFLEVVRKEVFTNNAVINKRTGCWQVIYLLNVSGYQMQNCKMTGSKQIKSKLCTKE